jgi:hypothetical protein
MNLILYIGVTNIRLYTHLNYAHFAKGFVITRRVKMLFPAHPARVQQIIGQMVQQGGE